MSKARASSGVVPKHCRSIFSAQAVMDMNGKEVRGQLLYVGRAQKWAERQNELKRKFQQMKQVKQDRLNHYQVRALNVIPSSSNPTHVQELGLRDCGGSSFQVRGMLCDWWGAWVLCGPGNRRLGDQGFHCPPHKSIRSVGRKAYLAVSFPSRA